MTRVTKPVVFLLADQLPDASCLLIFSPFFSLPSARSFLSSFRDTDLYVRSAEARAIETRLDRFLHFRETSSDRLSRRDFKISGASQNRGFIRDEEKVKQNRFIDSSVFVIELRIARLTSRDFSNICPPRVESKEGEEKERKMGGKGRIGL